MQKEDFPTLGGGAGGNSVSGNSSKTAVAAFHEQDARAQQASLDQAEMLSRSLREEAATVPTKPNSNNPSMPPNLSKSPSQPTTTTNGSLGALQSKPKPGLSTEQIISSGELTYDHNNNVWRNVSDGMMKNQFGLLALMHRSMLSSKETFLTKGIDLLTLGLP